MKDPKNNDERLSALLEGRLPDDERKEMMARLAASEDEFEVFTDTTEILMVVEEEDARAAAGEAERVIPLRPPARGPRLPVRWLALAASVVGVVLISTLALPGRGSPAYEPRQLAARVDALPKGWTPPTQSGGRGPAGSTSDDALAVYAGAMLVDISVAAQSGDTARTRELARVLSRRADPGASSAAPLEHIAANPGAPTNSLLALVDQAADWMVDQLDLERRPLELGAWTEAARLAAHRGNERGEAFFRDRATDGMLARAERVADNDAARAAVDRVREILRVSPPRWDSLEQELATLQRELTN